MSNEMMQLGVNNEAWQPQSISPPGGATVVNKWTVQEDETAAEPRNDEDDDDDKCLPPINICGEFEKSAHYFKKEKNDNNM